MSLSAFKTVTAIVNIYFVYFQLFKVPWLLEDYGKQLLSSIS